jgi:hypothetical protein
VSARQSAVMLGTYRQRVFFERNPAPEHWEPKRARVPFAGISEKLNCKRGAGRAKSLDLHRRGFAAFRPHTPYSPFRLKPRQALSGNSSKPISGSGSGTHPGKWPAPAGFHRQGSLSPSRIASSPRQLYRAVPMSLRREGALGSLREGSGAVSGEGF